MRKPLMVMPVEWRAADRMVDVVLMRHAGHTYSEIGRTLGVSTPRARGIYISAIKSRAAKWCWFQRTLKLNEKIRARQ